MANVLLTPDIWTDFNGQTPPTCWDGARYTISEGEGVAVYFAMSRTAMSSDDRITGKLTKSGEGYINFVSQDFRVIKSYGNGVHELDFAADEVSTVVLTSFEDGTSPSQVYGSSFALEPVQNIECDEVGFATRINANAYHRQRIHEVRVFAGEKRCLVVNWNAAISPKRTIKRVTYRVNGPSTAVLSDARISKQETQVSFEGWDGASGVTCTIELDNGERYVQGINVLVQHGVYWNQQPPRHGAQEVSVQV